MHLHKMNVDILKFWNKQWSKVPEVQQQNRKTALGGDHAWAYSQGWVIVLKVKIQQMTSTF